MVCLRIIDFTDPISALEYFRLNGGDRYSLIILDWKMPLMNGLILVTNIRQINKIVKIIMITAYDISCIKILPEYESVRLDQILQKPVRLSAPKEDIKKLLTVWINTMNRKNIDFVSANKNTLH
jgi:DNA-binding response OmpR family regulator